MSWRGINKEVMSWRGELETQPDREVYIRDFKGKRIIEEEDEQV